MNLNKEFFKEQSTYFSKEQRDEILTYTFILKADSCGNTATIANMIWRDYVDNIPKFLSKVLKDIYEKLMALLASENDESFDIAEGSIKMMVSKFSDKFFMELLPIIRDTIIEKKDCESIVYASFYILQLAVSEASEKLLSGFKDKMIKIVNENLHCQFSSVRKLLASIIYEIAKKFDEPNTNKVFIYNVMKQARNKPAEEQKNLLEIVGSMVDISKGEALHYAMNEIFRKPYEEGFLDLASVISDRIAENIRDPTDLKEFYHNISEVLPLLPGVTVNAIVNVTLKLDERFLNVFVVFLNELRKKVEGKDYINPTNNFKETLTFSEILLNFIDLTPQDISAVNHLLLELAVSLMLVDNNQVVKNAGSAMKLIIEKAKSLLWINSLFHLWIR